MVWQLMSDPIYICVLLAQYNNYVLIIIIIIIIEKRWVSNMYALAA